MATDCGVPTYLPASFKGMPFNVESSSDEFGRRGDLYEYPLSEETGYKDLGRKARRFRVQGYLVGASQVAQTVAMATVAQSPEPGILIHPMYGPQLVSCVTLTTTADYKKDIRRTKLSFEFIEANPSMAPYIVGAAISALFSIAGAAVSASKSSAVWVPTVQTIATTRAISNNLAAQIEPAVDEQSFDAVSRLEKADPITTFGAEPVQPAQQLVRNLPGRLPTARAAAADISFAVPTNPYPTFADAADPIDEGTRTVVRLHADALKRLRDFNRFVVSQSDGTPSVEALIVTARLALIRDYAWKSAQTNYPTMGAGLADLDFIMAVYDDEEVEATARCDDALVSTIRAARAAAASTILDATFGLPGVVEANVDGIWPSLVVAQKLFADGKRYSEVEAYNPAMPPFFIGRDVVAQTV